MSPSICRCSSPFGNLASCSLSFISCGNDIYGIFAFYLLAYTNVGIVDGAILPFIIFYALTFVLSYFFLILEPEAPPSSTLLFLMKTVLRDFVVVFLLFFNVGERE
jgi:hypothetical protein